ncbi:hypothetical protein QFC19_002689 [Naganishia cerealis]|uniref:Uncharacterized protein n=1 Tax=Naganishia cerealis TaxID=610337 RepID=A0ACC2W952_9TREE|nr:hypothetical protein QFC19_002689 [Naganishia cerealis]
MSKPSSRRIFRKPNHNALGLAGALGEDGGDSDGDLGGNAEENSSRAQRFTTNLEGNRFREVLSVHFELEKEPLELINFSIFSWNNTECKRGSRPLLKDVRTPATLKRTLDYLFYHVLTTQPPDLSEPASPLSALRYTHGFIRDRTRGIRQDFTYQRHVGITENIECHERIARFHILAIHEMARLEDAQFLKQETEQLNKNGRTCSNEPEFRAYQLLSHLNDNEVARTILDLPQDIFSHPHLQLAFTFRALAQRNFDSQKVGSKYNAEISLNFFSRFFKRAKRPDVPFLMACLAHEKFGDVRRAGLRALMRAYPAPPQGVVLRNGDDPANARIIPMSVFMKLLQCETEAEAMGIADALGVEPYYPRGIDGLNPAEPLGFLVNTSADFDGKDNGDTLPPAPSADIENKRSGATYQDIIDGKLANPIPSRIMRPLVSEPRGRVHSKPAASNPSSGVSAYAVKPASHSFSVSGVLSPSISSSLNPSTNSFQPSTFAFQSSQGPQSSTVQTAIRKPSDEFISKDGISQPRPSAVSNLLHSATPHTGTQTIESFAYTLPGNAFISQSSHPAPNASAAQAKPPVTGSAEDSSAHNSPTVSIQPEPRRIAKTVASPVSPKRPSKELVDSLAKRLASEALISYVKGAVHQVTDHTITLEQAERQNLYAKKKLQQRAQLERKLCERALIQMTEEVIREEVADAYGEEMWEFPLRKRTFTWWRMKARSKIERRERDLERAARQTEYKKHIQRLALGLPLRASADQIDLEESGTLPPQASDDVDQDATISLRKVCTSYSNLSRMSLVKQCRHILQLSKRKAILHEGTFFSALSSYVCNLSRTDENDPIHCEAMQEHINWHVVIAPTKQASGTWLKSKFNVRDKQKYTADYHGECRNATITALANPKSIPDSIGLVVFECSQSVEEDRERLAELLRIMPLRPVYQPGLLFVQWQDRTEASLISALALDKESLQFQFLASVNMAVDASDQTFISAIRNALPRMCYQPHFEVSMEDPATSLFRVARELLSFIDYLLLQNIDEPQKIAQLVAEALRIMERLQSSVLNDILGPLLISSDEYSKIAFDCSEADMISDVDHLLDWLVNVLGETAKNSHYLQAAYDLFSKARQREDDMIGRSVFECICDIRADVTQKERETLQEITQQACKNFEDECAISRSTLVSFAKSEYEKNRPRSADAKTEEEMAKKNLDSASQHLKSVLHQSVRATSSFADATEFSGRKRSYADIEPTSSADSQTIDSDKRQKPVPATDASKISSLSKLREALASARTVLKT